MERTKLDRDGLDWEQAFFTGVLAGAVLCGLLFLARITGMSPIDLSAYMGSTFTGDVSWSSWLLGFVTYLATAGVIGVAYGAAFESWGASGLERGLILAIPHMLLVGALLWLMPSINAAIPAQLPAPGFLAAGLGGVSAAVFILAHLVFGAIMGSSYSVDRLYVPAAPERSEEPARAWLSALSAVAAVAIVVVAAGYLY